MGNRLSQSALGVTTVYTHDDANRLTNAGAVPYTWDANGNLLADGPNTYSYDAANRLTSWNYDTFNYNGLGARTQHSCFTELPARCSNGGTNLMESYLLDLNAGLTQVLTDTTTTYLYGLSRLAQFTSTVTSYFLPDALGSVRQLTNRSGAVTLAKGYEPYGTVLNSSGSGSSAYGYTGEQMWMEP